MMKEFFENTPTSALILLFGGLVALICVFYIMFRTLKGLNNISDPNHPELVVCGTLMKCLTCLIPIGIICAIVYFIIKK